MSNKFHSYNLVCESLSFFLFSKNFCTNKNNLILEIVYCTHNSSSFSYKIAMSESYVRHKEKLLIDLQFSFS